MAFSFRFRRCLAASLLALPLVLAAPAQAQTAPPPTDVIREITDAVGLKARFELRATREVDNAVAVVYDGQRYLLYNPDFLNAVNRAGHTDWAGISILAHEMGHHPNGHTLRPGGSQPVDELEADEFSGQLTFRNDPNQRYYLTNALKVVRVDDEDNAEVVGHVTRTTNETFSYVLTDSQQHRLFITPRGAMCTTSRASA